MRANMLASFVVAMMASSGVLAHMEMVKPFPIKSKHDPKNTDGNIDYSMTRPLSDTDSADYPCFGYHKAASHSVETWTAGESYQMEIGGSANHRGGSCQLSLSYDDGATFTVIKSILGNCPLTTTYDFQIPASAPGGKNVLFAWTWFNKVGNREMYMNCARVDIEGGSGQLSGPEIFKANVGVTQCKTIEGSDVVFPNPGENVEYGNPELKSAPPTDVAGCGTPSGDYPPKEGAPVPTVPDTEAGEGGEVKVPEVLPSSSAVAPTAPAVPDSTAAPDVPAAPVPTSAIQSSAAPVPTSVAPAPSSPATLTTVKTAPVAAPTAVTPGACVGGAIQCSADGETWSICSNEAWIDMGAVAPGTSCRDGAMTFKRVDALGHCEEADGETKCTNDGNSWAVCLNGTWVDMGSVAAGTTCTDGQLVPLEKRGAHTRLHRHRRSHGSGPVIHRR